jgi:hypothetical protein
MKVAQRTTQSAMVRVAVLGSTLLASPGGWPADLTIPNTFVSGTPATAATVNENFSATATAVNSKQDLVTGSCPAGSAIRAVNQNGTVVCQQLNFFGGDGSAGDLTVVASLDWSSTPPANPNFANVTINAGQTLTVPAGTTIRCSGTFTNNGTLTVLNGAGFGGQLFPLPVSANYSIGHPGDAFRPASGGAYDDNAAAIIKLILGGPGGEGIPPATTRTSFNAFRIGGGSGAGMRLSDDARGGGLVKVYCAGNVVNAGTINAAGATAANTTGGGGGGIVIVASTSSVTNSGTINANGGDGGAAFNSTSFIVGSGGAGGGGGGGIVVFVAPSINSGSGVVNVAGGQPGSTAVTITTANRFGGGGGGASGGNGGDGGSINAGASATPASATSGAAGYVQSIISNPAYLIQ